MEAIGPSSALRTIADLVAKAADTLRRYPHANEHLQKLHQSLKTVQAETKLLALIFDDDLLKVLGLDEDTNSIFEEALSNVTSNFNDVLEFCSHLDTQIATKTGRLLWSVKGDTGLQKVLSRL
jgi:hypothetical protein